jgi:hypothetical protein
VEIPWIVSGITCDASALRRSRTSAALRLTNGNTALARWMDDGEARLAQYKVLAPLLVAEAMDNQFDIGNSQRRVA